MSNNLIKRTITSVILLIILLIVNFSHHYIFILCIFVLGIIICIEFNNIFKRLLETSFAKKNDHSVNHEKINIKLLTLNTVAFFYIFFIFCQLSYEIHKLVNPTFFLFIISICFFTDIGGYVFGKSIGGKKLTKISPNKTISGTVGSFIFSLIPILFFSEFNIFEIEANFRSVIFSLLVSLVSQMGDLFISYLKRGAQIKDTGKILPGHGGLLDRIDGMIFALPFSYLAMNII